MWVDWSLNFHQYSPNGYGSGKPGYIPPDYMSVGCLVFSVSFSVSFTYPWCMSSHCLPVVKPHLMKCSFPKLGSSVKGRPNLVNLGPRKSDEAWTTRHPIIGWSLPWSEMSQNDYGQISWIHFEIILDHITCHTYILQRQSKRYV